MSVLMRLSCRVLLYRPLAVAVPDSTQLQMTFVFLLLLPGLHPESQRVNNLRQKYREGHAVNCSFLLTLFCTAVCEQQSERCAFMAALHQHAAKGNPAVHTASHHGLPICQNY